MLAIETDEHGHRGYDKEDEKIRYDDLFMTAKRSGKWIFIRFNPDQKGPVPGLEDKLDILMDEIDKQIERIYDEENEDLVEIIYLFY